MHHIPTRPQASTSCQPKQPSPPTVLSTSALCLPQDSTIRLAVDPRWRDAAADGVHPSCGPCLPGATMLEVDTVVMIYTALVLGVPTMCRCSWSRDYMVRLGWPDACSIHRDTTCLSFVFFMAALGSGSVTSVLVKVYHLADTLTLRLLPALGGAVFGHSAVQLVSSRAEAARPGGMPPRTDPVAPVAHGHVQGLSALLFCAQR